MFNRFFSALSNLRANIEALAASFAETNKRYRQNVFSDGSSELSALNHQAESEEPAQIGRKRAAVQ
jgi:hypothetical protein